MRKITKILLLTAACYSTAAFAVVNPWQIRLRAIDIIPSASSETLAAIGGKVTQISSQVEPEFDISYYFTDHIAAELILATSRHSVGATDTALGNVNLGKVSVLPPTLTLQYHFLPNAKLDPYLGVGVNYTLFYDANKGPVASSVSYHDSFGPALQAGVDYALNSHWSLNLDVKKVYIKSNVTVHALGERLTPMVRINPLIVGLGVGYRF